MDIIISDSGGQHYFLNFKFQVHVAQVVFCALFGALIGKPLSKVNKHHLTIQLQAF